ncbi:MAG: hypothetical protein CME88_08410 [Hirschia sp.]|nr:hypothetical protein [Hirschia sp.]MBF18383.1 hypothetical protein [Hirschia sp.]
MFRTFELLAEAPLIGRIREPGRDHARRFVHNTHVIFYSLEEGGVLIETIIYGPMIRDVWGED